MARIYLAARYSRREELCGYREQLSALGHEVTSHWLNGEHQAADDDPGEQAYEFAAEDINDILDSDVIVSFTEEPRTAGASRGGRHVEHGFVLGMNEALRLAQRYLPEEVVIRRVIVVGHRENVFHWLPEIDFFETWPEALAALAAPALVD